MDTSDEWIVPADRNQGAPLRRARSRLGRARREGRRGRARRRRPRRGRHRLHHLRDDDPRPLLPGQRRPPRARPRHEDDARPRHPDAVRRIPLGPPDGRRVHPLGDVRPDPPRRRRGPQRPDAVARVGLGRHAREVSGPVRPGVVRARRPECAIGRSSSATAPARSSSRRTSRATGAAFSPSRCTRTARTGTSSTSRASAACPVRYVTPEMFDSLGTIPIVEGRQVFRLATHADARRRAGGPQPRTERRSTTSTSS